MSDSLLGRVFALADYREQAEFLNEAGKMLRRACDSGMLAEIQISRVVDELDPNGRYIVKLLAKFTEIE